MAITFQTPYYLSGKQKQRFHSNKAEKAGITAAGVGAAGYAVGKQKHTQNLHLNTPAGPIHVTKQAARKGAYVAAGVTAGYGAYHAGRAALYAHEAAQKKKPKAASLSPDVQHGRRIQH
jgi:hypothetical protein